MSEKLGPMTSTGRREQVFLGEEIAQRREFSEETAREVDEEVRRIIEESYDRARSTLEEHREQLDRVAAMLREREEIPGDEITRLFKDESGES